MAESVQVTPTGCCPPFDPTVWDGREATWDERLFVRDRVRSLLHIPLNFGGVMKRNMERIEAADACDPDALVLSDAASPWRTEVYLAVTKEVPGLRHERLSGTYLHKAFEGPYSRAGAWCAEFRADLERRGRAWKRLFTWYTTCPRCAKVYGRNHVVLIAEV